MRRSHGRRVKREREELQVAKERKRAQQKESRRETPEDCTVRMTKEWTKTEDVPVERVAHRQTTLN